ncbi:MAG TPA: hypothetical protein VE954_19495 [Oligoflexus sp.]|uniref:hypothetical protein n=1 Tax=Oligoflexus sp. TaxID=1971216 RepID=UPI002D4745ED|nr:hypothetical protein [Oligoflexus sp.]HYX35287.1 hypothetical protein [Oligoflexus sp.]
MKALDLRLLQLDEVDRKELEIFFAEERWTEFDMLTETVASKVVWAHDSVVLYHGTRLPNAALVRDRGLKLMTANDLAELVAPLWSRPAHL